jgi:anti-anti-sigma factor
VSLSIQVRNDTGAVVVAFAGAADASMLEPLRDPLTAALADARVLVLDLDEITTLDAAGLREVIVGVLNTARGGNLRIAASHQATVAGLAEARIHHLVAVHRSVADALSDVPDEAAS